MVKNRTLFVLGAGASHEVKMPTGEMLKKNISDLLHYKFEEWNHQSTNGDKLIYNALHQYTSAHQGKSPNLNELLDACRHISGAMNQVRSIDSFMELHHENKTIELVGKLAIVRSILEHEKNSMLWVNQHAGEHSFEFGALKKTWYTKFLHILTENCPLKSLPDRLKLLTIIDFNYDRCFEQYLIHALQNLYAIDVNVAKNLIDDIEIYHPYGTVGCLPWQVGEVHIEYGAIPSFNLLLQLSSQIKTYSEGTNSRDSKIDLIRQRFIEAKFVIFLGFAFHKQNMELLQPLGRNTRDAAGTFYFATAKDNSPQNIKLIEDDIYKLLGVAAGGMYVEDRTCNDFLNEYSRHLSLSFRA